MTYFRFPQRLWLLSSLLFLLLLLWQWRSLRMMAKGFWAENQRRLNRSFYQFNRDLALNLPLAALFLLSLVFSLMRPSGEPQLQVTEKRGRDVILLLDVSRSMDAQDLYPSRLERAKHELEETLSVMGGDRVALMVFAGSTVMKCPLTTDHAFLQQALEDVSSSSVTRGGTLMGDALRQALKELQRDTTRKQCDVILITDGEDHDSFPREAASALGEEGIRLIIIGLGRPDGEPIPLEGGGFLEYQGQQVLSKLDSPTLRAMASSTPGGAFVEVGTSSFQLSTIYKNLISSEQQGTAKAEEAYYYDERYQWYLIPGVLALILLLFFRATGRKYEA
ncbi:MAG: VWA domain-containing protein [Spirochaetaceae bacterium]|jgi:Ca-activated chloride channel family protein|nr:VWA domain-containing protein [Spirochaetaceae bacterium]